jgi:AcrR family transcriptional regulator
MPLSSEPDIRFESRRERERRQRREAMLHAAIAVFAERGYEQATLDEIAQRAEFGKGTLYNYFPGGKQTLLLAAFDDLFAGMTRVFEAQLSPEVLAETRIQDAFEALFRTVSEFFDERKQAFRVLVKEGHKTMLSGEAESMEPFLVHRERVIGLMERALEEGTRRGTIRPVPAGLVAGLVMELLKMTHMHQIIAEQCDWETPMPQMDAETTASLLRTLLFEGLSVPSAPTSLN